MLFEELIIASIKKPRKITGRWDLKPAGNQGGVCLVPYVSGLARPRPSSVCVEAAALSHMVRHFGHCSVSFSSLDTPAVGLWAVKFLCISCPHCKMEIDTLACSPPQDFCKE